MNTKRLPVRRLLTVGLPLLVLSVSAPFVAKAGISSFDKPAHAGYTGDGQFTDRGGKSSFHRFRLDLGDLDLNESGKHEFTLSGLPAVGFYAGLALDLQHPFDVAARPNDSKPDWFSDVKVKMTLTDTATGEKVFAYELPLSQYTWTNVGPQPKWSLLYNRGDFKPANENSTFTPKEKGEYKLTVEINSDTDEAVPAVLLVQGGRGKAG